jgi:iron-sulfur cluster repair protein YtfE (RIC family)
LASSDEILADLIQAGDVALLSEIHKSLILFQIRKNQWKYQFAERTVRLIEVIIVDYHCYQLHVLSRLSPYIDKIAGY